MQDPSEKSTTDNGQSGKSTQLDIYCDLHKNMKIILICKECIKPLCALCLTEHQSLAHRPGADLYEGIDRFYSQQLVPQELRKNLKKSKQILKQKLKQIENQKFDNERKASTTIDTLKQRLIKLLEEKKPEVSKLLEDEKKNTITAYKEYFVLFSEKVKKYKDLYKQFFNGKQNLKQLQDLCSFERQYSQLGIEKQIQKLISQLNFEQLPEQAVDQMLSELINTLKYSKCSSDITYTEQLEQATELLNRFGKTEEKLSKPDWDFSKILQSPNQSRPNKIETKTVPPLNKKTLQDQQKSKEELFAMEYSDEDEDQSSGEHSVDNMNHFRQMIKQSIQQRGVGNGLINKDQFVESKQVVEKTKNGGRSRNKKIKLNNDGEKNNGEKKLPQGEKKITRKRQTNKMVNASRKNKSNNKHDPGFSKELNEMKKKGLLE